MGLCESDYLEVEPEESGYKAEQEWTYDMGPLPVILDLMFW